MLFNGLFIDPWQCTIKIRGVGKCSSPNLVFIEASKLTDKHSYVLCMCVYYVFIRMSA